MFFDNSALTSATVCFSDHPFIDFVPIIAVLYSDAMVFN